MKYFCLLILITVYQASFAQIVFEGIGVTEFEADIEGWHKIKDGHYSYALNGEKFEKTGYFDEVSKILEDDKAEISFTCKKPTNIVFEDTYAKLVNMFGKEDSNKDYIPPNVDKDDYEHIAKLIKKGKAVIIRDWVVESGHKNILVSLIWRGNSGLDVVFSNLEQ